MRAGSLWSDDLSVSDEFGVGNSSLKGHNNTTQTEKKSQEEEKIYSTEDCKF